MKGLIVYRHRRKDNKEVFYVGIGGKRRPHSIHNRNKFWNNIVNKTDYDVEILAENLSVENAHELEILLIKEYGRRDLKTGSLCNLTEGGEGCREISKSTIKKMKENHKGMRGLKHNLSTIKKMQYNKKNLRPIIQFDLKGNFINNFRSVQEAKRSLNKTSNSITNNLKGITKSAFGFKWEYKNI